MISFSISGSTYHCVNKIPGELIYLDSNILYKDSECVVFKREDLFASRWFICVPVLFIRKNI